MSSVRSNDRVRSRKDRNSILAVLAAIIAVGLFAGSGNTAGTAIRIGGAVDVGLGETVHLPIMFDSIAPGRPIAAFDLLIQYPSKYLKLLDVQPGSLLSNCGWEYFTWRSGTSPECTLATCQNDRVRIVALADILGPATFSCHLTGPGTLATMTFLTSAQPDNLCENRPVQFLWEDCSDNMLALVGGDTVLISDGVYRGGVRIDLPNDSFPTFSGAPNTCLTGGQLKSITRGVDFYDGLVALTCANPVSDGAVVTLTENMTGPGRNVPIYIKLAGIEPGQTVAGFDFLISYPPTSITLLSVAMGDLAISHSWEYFNYTIGSAAQCGDSSCSEGYVRIKGTADIANGVPNPGGAVGLPGTLAELMFKTSSNPFFLNSTAPIRFAWYSCTDNVVATGAEPAEGWISRSVYDRGGFPYDPDSTYPPMFLGADSVCIAPATPSKVDFIAGRLDIVSDHQPVDNRGDINLNGVSNEVADHVLFSDWFMYGDWAFTLDNSAQRHTSDVNADGVEVTLDDLVYLYRVITGQAIPFPRLNPAVDTVRILQDTLANTVSVTVTDSLSALYLIFDGEIAVTPSTPPEFQFRSFFDTATTNVLISPSLSGYISIPTLSSGQLFSYTGEAVLMYAEASYNGLTPVPVEIPIGTYRGCGIGRAGNVDCDPNEQVDIADLARLIDYLFVSRNPLCCSGEGNCDGDEGIDIADLTRLIEYLYLSGGALAPCR